MSDKIETSTAALPDEALEQVSGGAVQDPQKQRQKEIEEKLFKSSYVPGKPDLPPAKIPIKMPTLGDPGVLRPQLDPDTTQFIREPEK